MNHMKYFTPMNVNEWSYSFRWTKNYTTSRNPMVWGPSCVGVDPGHPSPNTLTKPSSCALCVVSRHRAARWFASLGAFLCGFDQTWFYVWASPMSLCIDWHWLSHPWVKICIKKHLERPKKLDAMAFFAEIVFLNFLATGDFVCFHIILYLLVSGVS